MYVKGQWPLITYRTTYSSVKTRKTVSSSYLDQLFDVHFILIITVSFGNSLISHFDNV